MKNSANNILIKSGVMSMCVYFFSLTSCSDFVEVDLPSSQLSSEFVFEDATTANAAMAAIYANMRDSGLLSGNLEGLSCNLGLYTDELDFYRQDINSFYTNSLFAAHSDIKQYWNQSYNRIYAANAVLEGINNSETLPLSLKRKLRGEALFVRGLLHLYLNQLFDGVPYVTSTDYRVNSNIERLNSNQARELIKEDLLEAIDLLSDEDDISLRTKPSRGAANALLARVCLYNGQWEEAALHATNVIEAPIYSWVNNIEDVFLNNSAATIWQFAPSNSDLNTLEGNLFIFTSGPPPIVAITENLYNAFEPGDLRKENWIRSISDGASTWYHPFKYKLRSGDSGSTEYSIVLRLAEQYLIRAEARAMLGDFAGAKDDLNKVRNTAGLPNTDAGDQQSILNAVLSERRFELFTEFGHRFFDLQRTENLDGSLSGIKSGWNTEDNLWPIPADELILNPNLNPQNPSY